MMTKLQFCDDDDIHKQFFSFALHLSLNLFLLLISLLLIFIIFFSLASHLNYSFLFRTYLLNTTHIIFFEEKREKKKGLGFVSAFLRTENITNVFTFLPKIHTVGYRCVFFCCFVFLSDDYLFHTRT